MSLANAMKTILALTLLAVTLPSPAAGLKPGPPAVITIETRDLKVEFAGDRAWTLQRIYHKGELVADSNGFYGTVFSAEGGQWIGTGHNDGGIEQIAMVTLTVDGEPRDLADKAVYRGRRVELHKHSMMGPLALEATYIVTDDALLERHGYEVTADVKIGTLYAFMHPWLARTTEWIAQKADGAVVEGTFDSSGDFKLKDDPKWTALYNPMSRRVMMAWYPKPFAGQGIRTGYWDKTVYHKLYNQIYAHAAVARGTKLEASMVVRGVEADPASWKEAAKTLAAETRARHERGELVFAAKTPAAWLAEGGQSSYRIVVAANASEPTRYAAEELQGCLKKITGAQLPIVTDTEPVQPHEILVGRSSRLETAGVRVDWAALGKEGYVLRKAGERLVIAGGEPRGTLYGVYGLLEDHFGCRWFTPNIEHMPRIGRLPLPQLDERRVPVFESRETYLWESFDGNWMARNRLNGAGGRGRLLERQNIRPPVPELGARHGGSVRFGFGFFVHTMGKLVPPEKYFTSHPDYYALWKGQRDTNQLCCTHPDVIRLCTEATRDGMRAQPEATVFSLSQNDNRKYCECDRCAALGRREGTQMAQVLYLVNAVAGAIEAEFPDKIVETLAYQWSRQPPATMRPRRNVVIRLANIECCFAHPLAGGCSEANNRFVADLRAWAKVCDRLWVWDYMTDFSHYLLPFPNKRALDDNIRLFAANHVTGVFEEGSYDTPDGDMAALSAYMAAKFLWDPRYDRDRAMDEFLMAYYAAAAPPVRRYLDLIHDQAADKKILVKIFDKPVNPHLPPEMLAKADALWTEAETRTAHDPAALGRVRRSRMSVDYAIVEQVRAAMKTADDKRSAAQGALIALARKRFDPFMETLTISKLTRIHEWKDLDKAEYRKTLATDLGL
jgi:Domain of unknown function (DUF4838)/Glycosyl hydrolase family 67 N-terminus